MPSIREEIIATLPELRAFARSLTGNREQADDLAQDAIVRALRAANTFTPGTNFKAWIFTILRNLFYSELRKRRVPVDSIDDAPQSATAVAPAQDSKLEFNDFRKAFDQLRAEHREALVLVAASGLSYEDAAKVSGCAVGTMKSRVSRARAILVDMLGDAAADGLPLKSEARPANASGEPEGLSGCGED